MEITPVRRGIARLSLGEVEPGELVNINGRLYLTTAESRPVDETVERPTLERLCVALQNGVTIYIRFTTQVTVPEYKLEVEQEVSQSL